MTNEEIVETIYRTMASIGPIGGWAFCTRMREWEVQFKKMGKEEFGRIVISIFYIVMLSLWAMASFRVGS